MLSSFPQNLSVSQLPLVIKTPHALPMYRDDQGKGRKRPHEREAEEAIRTKRPDPGGGLPGLGLGKGGKLGATGGTLLTQYILQNQVRTNARRLECNVRHAWYCNAPHPVAVTRACSTSRTRRTFGDVSFDMRARLTPSASLQQHIRRHSQSHCMQRRRRMWSHDVYIFGTEFAPRNFQPVMLGHKLTNPPRAEAAATEFSSSVILMLFATALHPSTASSVTCAQPRCS